MNFQERLIHFQNKAEKAFEEKKTLSTSLKYILAFISFTLTTMFAGFMMPFKQAGRFLSGKAINQGQHIKTITGENIDVVLQEDLVLLDFWAEWCGPCIMMDPIIEKFAEENSKVIIGRINADKEPELLKHFKVRGLPQLIFFQNGEEINRHAGAMTLTELKNFTNPS